MQTLRKQLATMGLMLMALLMTAGTIAGDGAGEGAGEKAGEKADDAVWIDVRTEKEWNAGHLEQATLIPHTEIGDKISGLVSDKDAQINLYCRSGGRAGMAKKTLEEMGYTNVKNIGGYDDAKDYVAKQSDQ